MSRASRRKTRGDWEVLSEILKAGNALHDGDSSRALFHLAVATMRIKDVYPGSSARLQEQMSEAMGAVEVMHGDDDE